MHMTRKIFIYYSAHTSPCSSIFCLKSQMQIFVWYALLNWIKLTFNLRCWYSHELLWTVSWCWCIIHFGSGILFSEDFPSPGQLFIFYLYTMSQQNVPSCWKWGVWWINFYYNCIVSLSLHLIFSFLWVCLPTLPHHLESLWAGYTGGHAL